MQTHLRRCIYVRQSSHDDDNVSDNALKRSPGDLFITPANLLRGVIYIVIYRRSRENGGPILFADYSTSDFILLSEYILCGFKKERQYYQDAKELRNLQCQKYHIKIENSFFSETIKETFRNSSTFEK